ncbi:MAG: phosphatase PAP2 family protein [Pseudomonadota bacterium]|nr:phosphatase PAP2 family protein [Pseudomonadota bacterium]
MTVHWRKAWICMLLLATLGSTWPLSARAQNDVPDEPGDASQGLTIRKVLGDIGNYAAAPLHWDEADWMFFGGAVVAVGAAHQFDGRLRTHFVGSTKLGLGGKDTHSTQDALPAAAIVAGTGLYALLIDDPAGRTETWSMLEAGALSSATGFALKFAAGRERPYQTSEPNRWRHRGDSFPSLHVAAAFAIGTVLAESGNEDYRWLRRALGYGIAAATGYERLKHNVHWLSDTVAGAALGTASARFVLNHENPTPAHSFALVPIDSGVMLTYTVALR